MVSIILKPAAVIGFTKFSKNWACISTKKINPGFIEQLISKLKYLLYSSVKLNFNLWDRCRSILAVSILTTRIETNATAELKQKRSWKPYDKYRIDVYYFEIKNKNDCIILCMLLSPVFLSAQKHVISFYTYQEQKHCESVLLFFWNFEIDWQNHNKYKSISRKHV